MSEELDFNNMPESIKDRLDFTIDPRLGIFRPEGKEIGQLIKLTGWWHYFKRLVEGQVDGYPFCAGGVIKEITHAEGWMVYGAIAIYMPRPKLMHRRMLLCIPRPGWECDELIKRITEHLVHSFIDDDNAAD